MEVIKFPEATEQITAIISPVPLTETDAIIVKGADYQSDSVISVGNNTQATLYMDFTKGSLTGVSIYLYGSPLGNPTENDWYTETEETSSSGTLTLNPLSISLSDTTCKKMWHFPLGANRAYKITVKGTGTVNAGSLLKLTLSLRSN